MMKGEQVNKYAWNLFDLATSNARAFWIHFRAFLSSLFIIFSLRENFSLALCLSYFPIEPLNRSNFSLVDVMLFPSLFLDISLNRLQSLFSL